MPNPIKYSTSAQTLALKKGNFWIGTGDSDKGPTSTTSYYNGITPPSGGYTIYLNKVSGGPSIYTAANDSQLISLTNTISGASYTTANECFNYYAGQSDKMCVNMDYEGIVTNGLVLNLDPKYIPSYPSNGTTWYDLSGNNYHATSNNGASISGGIASFDGTDDYWSIPNTVSLQNSLKYNQTIELWLRINTTSGRRNPLQTEYWGEVSLTIEGGDGISYYWGGVTTNDGGNYCNSSTQNGNMVALNNWRCCVFTRDLSNYTITKYQNNTLVGSPQTACGPNASSAVTNSPLTIGTGYAGNYSGDIGIVRIYNRVLTTSELTQNYNAQKSRFGL
jgi:hypothetical protein